MNIDNMFKVGTYKDDFNKILNINLPCIDIYQSKGLEIHIAKRNHDDIIPLLPCLPEILSNPDYIGQNKTENNSIEFVKIYDKNILVAVKLDSKDNYLFVSSVYDISDGKLNNRVHSGRLKKIIVNSFRKCPVKSIILFRENVPFAKRKTKRLYC